jgi:hypothetical protein
MSRPSKTDQERHYLRSFWNELRTLEADHVGVTLVQANTSPRPGVFVFRLVFTPLLEEAYNPLGSAAVQIEFPNGQTQTLAGALWSAAMKLTTNVDDADRARRERPR